MSVKMGLSLLWVLALATQFAQSQYHYDTSSQLVYTHEGRLKGIQNRKGKDIVIGGLITVHQNFEQCDADVWEKGVELLEATLYAIDTINSDPNLLPNITLGYDIRDTCGNADIGLEDAIDLVLQNSHLDEEICQANNDSELPPVAVVLGALESFVSIPIARIYSLWSTVEVSYGSSSTRLSDQSIFGYFFRTFPPDNEQARAMIDLILYFNWNHISTVYSNDLYGRPGIDEINHFAEVNGICIDTSEAIDDSFVESDYMSVIDKITSSPANVVVLFLSRVHAESLLAVLNLTNDGTRKHLLWIMSDAVTELASLYTDVTAGAWGILPKERTNLTFSRYYSELTPENNKRDPWFAEAYQLYYGCLDCTNASITQSPRYQQYSVTPILIDAVYAIAHALDAFVKTNCDEPIEWYSHSQTCKGYNGELKGETLLQYVQGVNFTSPTGNHIRFDKAGNVEGQYAISNYQVRSSCVNCLKTYRLFNVAYWDGSVSQNRLQFFPNITKQFGVNQSSGDVLLSLSSQCQQCSPGFRRQVTSSCCGTCDPCLGSNYTNSTTSTECQVCPDNMWGNDPLTGSTGCVDIEESFLQLTDPWAIVLIVLAIIGLLAVAFVVGVFIWFWNTSIVKSLEKEKMILLLIGITVCFAMTVIFLLKPSPAACSLQQIIFWCSYTFISSVLLVEELYQIMHYRHKNFALKYQLLSIFLLVGIQMLLVIASLIVAHPSAKEETINNGNDFPVLVLQCTSPHIVLIILQMVYYSALIIASNALAIVTIRFHTNLRDSVSGVSTVFTLSLIWVTFVTLYFVTAGANSMYQVVVMSFTIQVNGIVVLLLWLCFRIFANCWSVKKSYSVKEASHVGYELRETYN